MPLSDNLARPTCTCPQKCVGRVMEVAEPTVRHLRDEVRDKSFLLELVKHAHLATESPCTRHKWKLAGHSVCSDAFSVLLGIGNKRLRKIMNQFGPAALAPTQTCAP